MKINVLDFGYVRLIEAWGHGIAGDGRKDASIGPDEDDDNECGIIEAARQSTQGSFRGWNRLVKCTKCGHEYETDAKPAFCCISPCYNSPAEEVHPGDKRLLRFLYSNKPQHATPFEFAGMVLEVQAPTCVVWEWVRHRTHTLEDGELPSDVAFNIMSSRYGEIPYFDLVPSPNRLSRVSERNKQAGRAKGVAELSTENAYGWLHELKALYEHSQSVYKSGLEKGVPKEIARLALTFGRYWRFRVTGYLRNWLGFLALRGHPDAQEEIREYANAVAQVVAREFPQTWKLFSTTGV